MRRGRRVLGAVIVGVLLTACALLSVAVAADDPYHASSEGVVDPTNLKDTRDIREGVDATRYAESLPTAPPGILGVYNPTTRQTTYIAVLPSATAVPFAGLQPDHSAERDK